MSVTELKSTAGYIAMNVGVRRLLYRYRTQMRKHIFYMGCIAIK